MKVVSFSTQAFSDFTYCPSEPIKENISWVSLFLLIWVVTNNCCGEKIISSGASETKCNFHNLQNQYAIFLPDPKCSLQIVRFIDHLTCIVLSSLLNVFFSTAEQDQISSSPSLLSGDAPESEEVSVGTSSSHPTAPSPSLGFCLCHWSPHLQRTETHNENKWLWFLSDLVGFSFQ